MSDALLGCRLKLERAVFQMKMLDEAIERFRQPETHRAFRYFDLKTDETVWITFCADPPVTWSPLMGDILHNLHSALDHLAWQLAIRRNYGHDLPPETRATFPIFDKRGRFWKKGGDGRWTSRSGVASLRCFPGDARPLVLALQPYQDRERAPKHPLAVLHALSNEDKHKTLHVVGTAMVDSELEIKELTDTRIDHFTPIHGPLRGPTEIGRIKLTPIGPNPKAHLQPAFAVAETFGERVPRVAGRYIGEVFNEIATYIIDEVFAARFAPYFGVNDWDEWEVRPSRPQAKDPA